MFNNNSVVSIISHSFPYSVCDHKSHTISKTQKAHDKAFIEAMCLLFVFGLIAPSIEQKRAPKKQNKLDAYDVFTIYDLKIKTGSIPCVLSLSKVSPIFTAMKKILIS